jgi:DNA-binding transcriptional ArsR family regulator
MPHPLEHSPATRPLDEEEANRLAESMSVFATGSRLRILYGLLERERSVDELAEVTGLSANVVSQQLRVLRAMRFVRVRRHGRRAFYALHDHHLVDLLQAIRHHAEHVTGSWPAPAQASEQARSAT